jgi:hypothetical protein
MAKKTLTGNLKNALPGGGMSGLIGGSDQQEEPQKKRGPKKTEETEKKPITSFITNKETIDKIKAIAYWERLSITEAYQSAMDQYFASYEKKNGAIKPVPEGKK